MEYKRSMWLKPRISVNVKREFCKWVAKRNTSCKSEEKRHINAKVKCSLPSIWTELLFKHFLLRAADLGILYIETLYTGLPVSPLRNLCCRNKGSQAHVCFSNCTLEVIFVRNVCSFPPSICNRTFGIFLLWRKRMEMEWNGKRVALEVIGSDSLPELISWPKCWNCFRDIPAGVVSKIFGNRDWNGKNDSLLYSTSGGHANCKLLEWNNFHFIVVTTVLLCSRWLMAFFLVLCIYKGRGWSGQFFFFFC